MPSPDENGWIPTLNGMGWMTSSIDFVARQFIDFSATAAHPVVDIGCAYGSVALESLMTGATVIAIDADSRHLKILLSRAGQALDSRLDLICGYFPEVEICGPISAAYAGRIFHFLNGPDLEKAAHSLFNSLANGGKVFVMADSPYRGTTRSFIEEYEHRERAGARWPGYIEDISKYNEFAASNRSSLPEWMHLLDPKVLSRTFKEAGFAIELAEFVSREDLPAMLHHDGREGVALIARKP